MDFFAKLTGRHDEPALPPIFGQLEELVVIHAGEESYPLASRIRAVALSRLRHLGGDVEFKP